MIYYRIWQKVSCQETFNGSVINIISNQTFYFATPLGFKLIFSVHGNSIHKESPWGTDTTFPGPSVVGTKYLLLMILFQDCHLHLQSMGIQGSCNCKTDRVNHIIRFALKRFCFFFLCFIPAPALPDSFYAFLSGVYPQTALKEALSEGAAVYSAAAALFWKAS